MEELVAQSDAVVVAPVFFSTGNTELLRVALETARKGRPVIFLEGESLESRDLTGGEGHLPGERSPAGGRDGGPRHGTGGGGAEGGIAGGR